MTENDETFDFDTRYPIGCTPTDEAEAIVSASVQWDYWAPHDFVIGRGELHVGIVQAAGETFVPLFVAAVVAPLPSDPPTQNEGMAMMVKNALAAGPWTERDGLRDWLNAHGGSGFPWPAAALKEDQQR